MFKFKKKVPPVNSEVLVHLKNIESPTSVCLIQILWSVGEFHRDTRISYRTINHVSPYFCVLIESIHVTNQLLNDSKTP